MPTTLHSPPGRFPSPGKQKRGEQKGALVHRSPLSSLRILVVAEDGVRFDSIRTLCPAPRSGSGAVHWLARYETARDAVWREAYDVVVLDTWHLGRRLLSDLARAGSDTPVVVLVDNVRTGHDTAGVTCEFVERRALDKDNLRRAIRDVVNQAATTRTVFQSQSWWRHGGPALSHSDAPAATSGKSAGIASTAASGKELSTPPERPATAAHNDLLEDLLDHLPLIAAHIDDDGTILDCGGWGLQTLGFTPESLQGRNVFAHPDFPTAAVRQAMRGTPVTFVRTWAAAGRTRHFECHFRFDSARQRGAVGFAYDVTDRVETARARANREQMLAGVLRHAPGIIGRLDANGCICEVDGAGLTPRDLAPHDLNGAQFTDLFPDGQEAVARALGGGSARFDVTLNGGSGQKWQGEFHLSFDQHNGSGAVFFGKDLTTRRRLERELVRAVDAERQRLGADLHDEVGQLLTGLTCLSSALVERLRGRDDLAAEQAASIAEVAREALAQTRSLARGLAPVRLAREGLRGTLEDLRLHVRRVHDVDVRLQVAEDAAALEDETAGHVFRIIQESITNAVRHGQATIVDVSLVRRHDAHHLTIADNGRGFELNEPRQAAGSGLGLMEYRAGLIGGRLRVSSAVTTGTRIEVLFTTTETYPHENACWPLPA